VEEGDVNEPFPHPLRVSEKIQGKKCLATIHGVPIHIVGVSKILSATANLLGSFSFSFFVHFKPDLIPLSCSTFFRNDFSFRFLVCAEVFKKTFPFYLFFAFVYLVGFLEVRKKWRTVSW
jgi:hypothetical protein